MSVTPISEASSQARSGASTERMPMSATRASGTGAGKGGEALEALAAQEVAHRRAVQIARGRGRGAWCASEWASSHSTKSGRPASAACAATPATVPSESAWSPPMKIGRPRPIASRAARASAAVQPIVLGRAWTPARSEIAQGVGLDVARVAHPVAQLGQRLNEPRRAVGVGAHQAAAAPLAAVHPRPDQDAVPHHPRSSEGFAAKHRAVTRRGEAAISSRCGGRAAVSDEGGRAKWTISTAGCVALLRRDARAPLAGLAAALGVGRATVRARIERLVARRDILGFTVTLKEDVARSPVRGLVMIAVEGRAAERLIHRLTGWPEGRGGPHHPWQVGSRGRDRRGLAGGARPRADRDPPRGRRRHQRDQPAPEHPRAPALGG